MTTPTVDAVLLNVSAVGVDMTLAGTVCSNCKKKIGVKYMYSSLLCMHA